jgi:hypothetical protein
LVAVKACCIVSQNVQQAVMAKKISDARYINLEWRGANRTPLTIRLDAIESLSPTIDKGGTKLSYGGGQTATVTMPYATLLTILNKHVRFLDLPADGGHEQPLPRYVTEGPNRVVYVDGAEGPELIELDPDA